MEEWWSAGNSEQRKKEEINIEKLEKSRKKENKRESEKDTDLEIDRGRGR